VRSKLQRPAAQGGRLRGLDELIRERFPAAFALLPEIAQPPSKALPPIPTLHALLSSAIDVDKISYLIADSHATGVGFGAGMDIEGLIQSLVPPQPRHWDRGALAIREEGLAAAESVIAARYWMISRVYWHHTNRSAMAMHKFVLADLMRHDQFDFRSYFDETFFGTHTDGTRLLAKLYAGLHGGEDARPILSGLLNGERTIYARAYAVGNGPSPRDRSVYSTLVRRGPIEMVELAEGLRTELESEIGGLASKYGDFVVDVPHKTRDFLGRTVLVYMDRDLQEPRELAEGDYAASPMLKGMAEDFESNVKKCRVFVHPEVVSHLRESDKWDAARKSIREYMDAQATNKS
jgi:hypothetical protein